MKKYNMDIEFQGHEYNVDFTYTITKYPAVKEGGFICFPPHIEVEVDIKDITPYGKMNETVFPIEKKDMSELEEQLAAQFKEFVDEGGLDCDQ